MSGSTRLKWWQQEIVETVPTEQQNVPAEEEKPDLEKAAKKFVDGLKSQLEGPKVGVQYKIEVTGQLDHKDGTFWACPVSSGFIHDKLEPLSKLLRSSILADPDLTNVDKLEGLVCVQSPESNLWVRGIVIKEVKTNSVKLQLVDVGRIEEHQKSKLCKVPESLASIPYMAFCCMLFEQNFKMTYEDKWKFNDLVKKKILNFTCEKIIEQDDKKVLVGQMETIIDKPIMNINEEMKHCIGANSSAETHLEKSTKSPSMATRNIKKSTFFPPETHNNKVASVEVHDKKKVSTGEFPSNKKGNFLPGETRSNRKSKKINAGSPKGFDDSKPDCKNVEAVEALTERAGPICGMRYQVEVTSPLNPDGTFWACPVTSGFIRDKLEPMADLLRAAILIDQGLRNVDSFEGMICVQSKEYRMLMRGFVLREVDASTVKVQLIDCGRNEEHLKAKLYKVPELLSIIPYMAFHCALYKEKVKLTYEQRWRFADLCKRRAVEFTLEKIIERDQKKLLNGKIEANHGSSEMLNVIEELERVVIDDND